MDESDRPGLLQAEAEETPGGNCSDYERTFGGTPESEPVSDLAVELTEERGTIGYNVEGTGLEDEAGRETVGEHT